MDVMDPADNDRSLEARESLDPDRTMLPLLLPLPLPCPFAARADDMGLGLALLLLAGDEVRELLAARIIKQLNN